MSRADLGKHRLWMDASGNVKDRSDPRNQGKKLRDMPFTLKVWPRGKRHPDFRVSGGSRYWIYNAPVRLQTAQERNPFVRFFLPPLTGAEVGAVLVVWYEFETVNPFNIFATLFRSQPVFAMIRVDTTRRDTFLFSAWEKKHLEGIDPPPPAEVRIKGQDLHKLESVFSGGTKFSALARGFREDWAPGWKTPVQKKARAEARGRDPISVVEAVLESVSDTPGAVVDEGQEALKPLLDGIKGLAVIALVVAGFWFFGRRR